MGNKKALLNALLIVQISLMSQHIEAQTNSVAWVNWKNSRPSKITGSILTDSGLVKATFSGKYSFAQLDGGTNYWQPAPPYISEKVTNAPANTDIIGLSSGGTATITFSQAVQDPVIALVSWNGNTADFGVPIELLSYSQGYWGNGTPVINETSTGFYGDGDLHGVIQLKGSYQSITFTHTSEHWHGFTIGVPITPVPTLSGSMNGLNPFKVTCVNNTTGQSISISDVSKGFNCKKSGLQINSSEEVTITINGDIK